MPVGKRASKAPPPVGPYHILFMNAELHLEARCYPDGSTQTFDTLAGEEVRDPPPELYPVRFTSAHLHIETRRYLDGSTRTVDSLSGKLVPDPTIKDGRPLWGVRRKVTRGAHPTWPDPLAGWLATLDAPTWDLLAERWRTGWCLELEALSTGEMTTEQRGWIIEQLKQSP